MTTRNPPRALEALPGLRRALMAKELTPGQMLGELMVVCNALTASGVDVPADNKRGADLVLSAATTQGAKICDSYNGRGTIETITHDMFGRDD